MQTIPAGRYAVGRLVGSYAGLAAAWGELVERWVPFNGYSRRPAPRFEVYRTDPAGTPAAEWLTDPYEPIYPE